MEPQTSPAGFESLWEAMGSRVSSAYSPAYQAGLMGAMMRRAGNPPLASDLNHLWIPGMNALGIEARLLPLASEEAVQAQGRPADLPLLLFGFAGPLDFTAPEEIDDTTPLPGDTDPAITAQALSLKEASDRGLQEQSAGDLLADTTTLRSRFSHLLTLERAGAKPLRRDSVQAVLHRWLAWHAAYPEQAPREADTTALACALATAFLAEVVGTRRDFVSNRLRYAARCFESAQIACAYDWLQEAGIATWRLPAATAEALRCAPESPLPDTLRRELIYLARAGTLPLKTLAARRLTHERHHPDAHKTLHQLRFDSMPWVRAAARPTAL